MSTSNSISTSSLQGKNPKTNTIKVEKFSIFSKYINIMYSLNNEHIFQTKIFYPNGDLEKIKDLYSKEDLNKIF